MQTDSASLRRWRRLARLRTIAREAAARQVAAAERERKRLRSLEQRLSLLVSAQPGPSAINNGEALKVRLNFAAALDRVRDATSADAARQQALSNQAIGLLGEAERRRTLVVERVTAKERLFRSGRVANDPTSRRSLGTEHE